MSLNILILGSIILALYSPHTGPGPPYTGPGPILVLGPFLATLGTPPSCRPPGLRAHACRHRGARAHEELAIGLNMEPFTRLTLALQSRLDAIRG